MKTAINGLRARPDIFDGCIGPEKQGMWDASSLLSMWIAYSNRQVSISRSYLPLAGNYLHSCDPIYLEPVRLFG